MLKKEESPKFGVFEPFFSVVPPASKTRFGTRKRGARVIAPRAPHVSPSAHVFRIRVRDASVSDHTLMSVDASIEALAEHYVVD